MDGPAILAASDRDLGPSQRAQLANGKPSKQRYRAEKVLEQVRSKLGQVTPLSAREFHLKTHVVHLIVDGQIDTPKPNPATESIISPDRFRIILFTGEQTPDAWTHLKLF